MYLLIGSSLLSLKSLSPSVAHFAPILRFTSVLPASATEEKPPFPTWADRAA